MEIENTARDAEGLRHELARLEAKRAATDDQDIREALDGRIAALRSELQRSEGSQGPPSTPKGPKPAEVEAQLLALRETDPAQYEAMIRAKREVEALEPPPPPPTPEDQESAERMVRESRVAKMRQQPREATDLLKKAAAIAPGSPVVQMALADELFERSMYREAMKAYRTVLQIEPTHSTAERRYGECALRASGVMTAFAASEDPEAVASAQTATLLSLIVPGSGQLVLGERTKGVAILVAWLLCITLVIVLRQDLQGMLRSLTGASGGGGGIVVLPVLAALGLHLWSVGSCLSRAKGGGRSRDVQRPSPPMNLPFE
jgi:tetratricopeptide (TPR) repeat protein